MNQRQDLGRIGVLMGGVSSERDISLKSGQAVYKALEQEQCDAIPIDITGTDEKKIVSRILGADIDIAFIALHGHFGEDGTIQGILERANIPYTGSNSQASHTTFNKILTQNILKQHGLNIAPYISVTHKNVEDIEEMIGKSNLYPAVIKPASEGSSFGITIVENASQLQKALESAWEFDNEILIEAYIKGRECTVGILNEKALPVVEICPRRSFFDFVAKYEKGCCDYIVPARIPEETVQTLQHMALKTHNLLGCSSFSRVDFMLSDDLTPYVLEINTIPGFTSTSLLPKAAKEAGINFNHLVLKIVENAYGKKKKDKNITLAY